MSRITQIMTHNPEFLSQHTNVNKARMTMAEKKIRHLPIKDSSNGKLIGILSQKSILSNAIKIINQRGMDKLEYIEKSMSVASIMDSDPAIFDINADIRDVAASLLEQRSGCIAIEENNQLVGVITSSDFVKLALRETQ